MGGPGDPVTGETRPDAENSATSTNQPQSGQQQDQDTPQAYKDWQELIDSLQRISEVLSKEEEIRQDTPIRPLIQLLSKEIKRAKESRVYPPDQEPKDQLDRIETGIKALRQDLRKNPPTQEGPERGPSPKTWANVAAQQAKDIRTARATGPPIGTTIRIRPEGDLKGRSPKDLLEIARKAIPAALAVRPLRSGDIDLHVKNQAIKDKILNGPHPAGFKVLRKDYLLEIPSVPLATTVASGKHGDNQQLIQEICTATRRQIPGLTISKISWLHDITSHAAAARAKAKPATARGTLIIGVPTQALQQSLVRSGIIIDAQFFEARLFDHGLILKQCYNCNQWGHTTSSCGKPACCGHCAGPHSTRSCPQVKTACTNCGKEHKAWQRQACPTFQAYLTGIQAKKISLLTETTRLRQCPSPSSPQSEGFQLVTRKRGRSPASQSTQSSQLSSQLSRQPSSQQISQLSSQLASQESSIRSRASSQTSPPPKRRAGRPSFLDIEIASGTQSTLLLPPPIPRSQASCEEAIDDKE
jgi:hypothetical protein